VLPGSGAVPEMNACRRPQRGSRLAGGDGAARVPLRELMDDRLLERSLDQAL